MTDPAPMSLQQEIARDLQVSASFNARQEIERRVAFLTDLLTSTGLRSLVLGISGGVDSMTAGRLCQLAVERARAARREATFFAMRLPYGAQSDEKDARLALEFIRPDRILNVDVKPASDAALEAVLAGGTVFHDAHRLDFVHGNIKARQRMIAHYAVANAHEGLVVGTDHAAEAVSGFFTKVGRLLAPTPRSLQEKRRGEVLRGPGIGRPNRLRVVGENAVTRKLQHPERPQLGTAQRFRVGGFDAGVHQPGAGLHGPPQRQVNDKIEVFSGAV